MLFDMQSPRRKTRTLYFMVDGSVPSLLVGAQDGTLAENSSGNYTITFAQPGTRCLNVQATSITDVSTMRVIEATALIVNVEQVGADQTTPLADADFYLTVTLQDTESE